MKDPTAFIFSLSKKDGYYPEKLLSTVGQNALYDTGKYGPTFGAGHDINIANNTSQNSDSFYRCHSFKCPSFWSADRVCDRMTFTPNDIEVLLSSQPRIMQF